MNKNAIVLMGITITILTGCAIFAAYAYISIGNLNVTNITNLVATSERNNMVFDTVGGQMILNVTASNMSQAGTNSIASQNSTTLTVNFQANTSYSMVCMYDIIYEWKSSDKYQTHTSGVSANEFTIQATLASNNHSYEGTNYIKNEVDLVKAVGSNNSIIVVEGAQIDSTGTATSTSEWTITSKFYNVNANQNDLANKTYNGTFKVSNVQCITGDVQRKYWYAADGTHPYPEYGGTLQSTGAATGQTTYIMRDSFKNYVCQTFSGQEVCLSQSYNKYGLENHTSGNFTTAQQTSAKNFLNKVFFASGVSSYTCTGLTTSARCAVGNLRCGVSTAGSVFCINDNASKKCYVTKEGSAYCQ